MNSITTGWQTDFSKATYGKEYLCLLSNSDVRYLRRGMDDNGEQIWKSVETDRQYYTVVAFAEILNREVSNESQVFDSYEIKQVGQFFDNGTFFCEPIGGLTAEEIGENCQRKFWSLYGHIEGKGTFCFCDMDNFEDITKTYERITGNKSPEKEGDYTNLPN